MIRTSKKDQPVYREVLKHAFHTAWHDRRYWILSLLAGILVTAGSYDVLWRAVTAITTEGHLLSSTMGDTIVRTFANAESSVAWNVVSVIGGIEALMLMAIVGIAVATVSCIAQGGLVYALGAKKRGQDATLSDAFRVGSRALWPIVALNVLVFAVIWILRFLAALPLFLALQYTTTSTYFVFLLSFAVFVPLSFLIAIIQIFALNGMILQGAPIGDAVRRGYLMFKKNWVVVIETAVIQAAVSMGIWFLCILAFLILMIPSFILVLTAAVVQSTALFSMALLLGTLITIAGLIAAAAFTIQLQYATWTYLYRRLGEGGVVPKLHRIVRNLTGVFRVPQS